MQSEAVAAAINGKGNGHLEDRFGNESEQPASGQWNPITPGLRPIPRRSPESMTNLQQTTSRDDHNQATPSQNNSPASSRWESIGASHMPSKHEGANHTRNSQSQLRTSQPSTQPLNNQSWNHLPPLLRPGRPEQKDSTLENLKSAAAGIHGVGETLRGTISQTADRRFRPGKAPDAAMAKHQGIIDAGKYEMEQRKFAPTSFGARDGHAQPPQGSQQSQGPRPTQPQGSRPIQSQGPHNSQRSENVTPDTSPSHIELSRRRFSGGYTSRPQSFSPESAPQKETGGLEKWLRKVRSHPSDKDQDKHLRNEERPEGKLKRRSKLPLGSVAE